MSFYSSPIRSALIFIRCYENLKPRCTLTKKQVLFLAYIVENEHMIKFSTKALTSNGIGKHQAYQFLSVLRRKGYVIKVPGYLWELTDRAISFYGEFRNMFDRYYKKQKFWT